VILYGCAAWSLILREEHRLRVFENRVLRRIFGPKRDEAIGGLRKLHDEKFHKLYSLASIIRMIKSKRIIRKIKSKRMRWAGHVARMGIRGMHVGFWWDSWNERDHKEDVDIGESIILKCI
jgi:hypothetical protein